MINDEITDKEVRLVDENGEALGIVSSKEALDIAIERNLDLVKIAPQANPPVCKIMDYGKYLFDLAKKEKEVRKNQKVVNIKEVRMGLDIGDHDLDVKVKQAIKFLKAEDKVKLTIRFYGRQMNFISRGQELVDRFIEEISEFGEADKKAKLEGRRMSVIINPK